MTAWREGALVYHITCCHKTLDPNYHESKWVWVSRPWIKLWPSRCAASPKKIKDGNNRGGRQQQCLSSSNQVVIRKHKKAKKNNNQPPKWRRRARLVAGKGANVSRLTGMGSAQDEATEVEQQACKRGGGVTSIIAMSTEGIINDRDDHCSCCHTPFNG